MLTIYDSLQKFLKYGKMCLRKRRPWFLTFVTKPATTCIFNGGVSIVVSLELSLLRSAQTAEKSIVSVCNIPCNKKFKDKNSRLQ